MKISDKNILITGGAGFIGSHLVDKLIENNKITVLDNLITSEEAHINSHLNKSNFTFIKDDVNNIDKLSVDLKNTDIIFHFAANYSVEKSTEKPIYDLKNNFNTTINLLEYMRKYDIPKMIYASSSVVYGETKNIPTPENENSKPISNYGASKSASEAYLSAYNELYDINSISLRFANIYGPRSDHGVMYDFYNKLKNDNTQLEILGDGKQAKSYLYIEDCIDATIIATKNCKYKYEAVNIGSDEQIQVKKIADYVCNAMNLSNVKYKFTGGKRGWEGDVPLMLLDISKLKKMDFKPKINFKEGLKKYINILNNS